MIKKIIEHKKFIIILILVALIFNIRLPYYVNAPGGVIDITNRITTDKDYKPSGTLNLLYVTEYDATLPTLLMGTILKDYDISKNEERSLNNESSKEIYNRNKIMLDNSVQNALFVAYNYAGKEIEITGSKNIVIGTTNDNNLKVGDIIIKVDNKEVSDISEIKDIITKKSIGDSIKIKIVRDNKEKEITSVVQKDKKIGVVIVTNYEYILNPEIDIKFKARESGASGGLMLSLSIYNAISDEDIIKGRNIAGTGTIDKDGNVGEIDGIKYKIIGAVKNNINLIFVPEANYNEALKVKKEKKYNITIVKIKKFEEAINYLTKN